MAKPKKNDDRRARLEAMRREAQRAERRRTLTVVVACALVAAAIVVATAVYLLRQDETPAGAATSDGGSIGDSASSAGCDNVVLKEAEGSNDHKAPNTEIDYPDAPPAFGPHWPAPADFARKFYTSTDRPPVEQLVHNLEHGYTILWYDATVADDSDALAQVQAIAQPFEGQQDLAAKFIAAPWTSDDGDPFPEGKHVALTHWSAEGELTGDSGQGEWLYCSEPSAAVVTDFMAAYPFSDALEPNGA